MTEREENRLFYMFVADEDSHRTDLKNPFLQDGSVIATDSHILIKIRKELLKGSYEEKKAPDVSRVWPKTFNPVATLTRKEIVKTLKKLHLDNGYDELPLWITCKECYGVGTVTWNYRDKKGKNHTNECDCPMCDGSGQALNGTDCALGIYNEWFVACYIIAILETMNIFKVEFIIYAPSDGVTAAQFRVCDGVDIIVMPQQYMKPNAWIAQKGKRRR